MEKNVDNTGYNVLKPSQNGTEKLARNYRLTSDTNCVADSTNHNITGKVSSTDSVNNGFNSCVDVPYDDDLFQIDNYNHCISLYKANLRNLTAAAQTQYYSVSVSNPSDLDFAPTDMNVDIEGKGPTAAAAGPMNIVSGPKGSVNNTSGGVGPRNRSSAPGCQDRVSAGKDGYHSGGQQSASYAAEFDPLAGMSRGYGAEGGVMRGRERYGNDRGAASSSSRDHQASAADGANSGDKAAYELLDREMQYMLKFADPDQNLASMDELIQSGVNLLDLLPPEEGGVKPRFSNPSNDWKYDMIAKYVDACNPVSECTCHHYDGRRHDIHLCSVHHDTVSQDSDTLTMDTEGSLVNIPTIKLHSTYPDGKTDLKNNNNTGENSSSSTTTVDSAHSQPNQHNTKSEIIDKSAPSQDAVRTEANNKGGNIVVGSGASECPAGRDQQGQSPRNEATSGDKSADKSSADTANHSHQYYGVDGRDATGNRTDQTEVGSSQGQGEGHDDPEVIQNSTVVAEVHVDATRVKYDEPSSRQTTGNTGQKESPAGKGKPLSDPVTQNKHEGTGNCDNNKQGSHNNPASPTPNQQPQSQQQTNKDNTKTKTSSNPSSESPNRTKENYDKFLSRPPTTSVQDHRKRAFTKRPSLPIEPRTTQYQKHALLQERSDTGVLEFELLLAERYKDEEERPRRESLNARKCSLDSSRMKLLPRTNQYEPHPLLRKTNSGMSEIEEVLQEKEQEFVKKMKEKRDSIDNSRPDSKKFMLHRGSLGRLEPRLGQYEKHSLLQSKDEDGKTALEMFLEEELTERKASMTENDANYSDKEKLAPKKSNASDTSSTKGSIKKSRSKSSSLKKVHFERSGNKDKKKKPDEPESGISKGEVSSTSDPKTDQPEGQGQSQGQTEGQEVDNGYDTDDDDKTEEDRLTGERAKAKLNKDQGKCCTIL